jgi:glycosyltransferase involved in cell wall biosynthesis
MAPELTRRAPDTAVAALRPTVYSPRRARAARRPARRVLYVLCSEHVGGAEIVMERLISSNRDGVAAVALCSPGGFAERLRASGCVVVEEPALALLFRGRVEYSLPRLVWLLASRLGRVTCAIAKLLRRHHVDAVHANGVVSAFYALPSLVAARALAPRVRWLWTNHDLTFPDGELTATLARLCYRLFDRTIAVSRALRDRYARFRDRSVVIYNGLDLERMCFRPEARTRIRAEIGARTTTVVVGIVGMIQELKGHDLLLEAVRALREDGHDILLAVVGSFHPTQPAYEQRIRAMLPALGPAVRMLGYREDVADVYSALDVVVNASRYGESLGTTIYEAMACERIVVATRTGGSAEIVEDGGDGFLCAPNDAGALRDTLRRVLTSWDSLDGVRAAARTTVVARFGIERMRQDYNVLLWEVCDT